LEGTSVGLDRLKERLYTRVEAQFLHRALDSPVKRAQGARKYSRFDRTVFFHLEVAEMGGSMTQKFRVGNFDILLPK
jgi:hypothetical protein